MLSMSEWMTNKCGPFQRGKVPATTAQFLCSEYSVRYAWILPKFWISKFAVTTLYPIVWEKMQLNMEIHYTNLYEWVCAAT